MANALAWGILGTGKIAETFAKALAGSAGGRLIAVASRQRDSADRFGETFAVARRYGSYEALLADDTVQAVYIATPHPFHAEWAIKAARAGKHLLVEKPIGLNHAEAMAVVEAAREHDVFLMEAFMYRCHPQTAKLVELLRNRAIGDVRVIHATFSFHWPDPYDPEHRLLSNELGGGGILDVGCYCTSMARLIAGVATGGTIAEPSEIKAIAHLGEAGTDDYSVAVTKFPGGIVAQLSCGVQVNQESILHIDGSEGHIVVPAPWIPARDGGASEIFVHRNGQTEPQRITVHARAGLYSIEADIVAASVAARQATFPAMTWDDTLGNMRALDAWRVDAGLTYESERPAGYRKTTVRGTRLAVARPSKMKYGVIEDVDKRVSRVLMGCMEQRSFPEAAVLFDDFFERGGNAFDTAYVYGRGLPEQFLGQWIRHRGVRNEVVVIVKGAHPPFCTPQDLTRELLESLDRLQTDCADVYLMHRDNPAVPIGEFVDVLNEHARAGRIRSFGGSNWTTARLDAANAYAANRGLNGFRAVSNNFSLARMVDAPWGGCLAASEPPFRAWLRRTRMPLLAWSSQARGFFIPGRAAPDKRDDAELARCWYSPDNFERLRRAHHLAKKYGVDPVSIALAYVLSQPFPTFALIGPQMLGETRSSLAALDVALEADEVMWLNLEDGQEDITRDAGDVGAGDVGAGDVGAGDVGAAQPDLITGG